MSVHELKVWPDFFPALLDGSKPFEIRRNDRPFAVGDVLWLREYSPGLDEYTGREIRRRVTYLMDGIFAFAFGVREGFVLMGLECAELAAALQEGGR